MPVHPDCLAQFWLTDGMAQLKAVSNWKQHFILATGCASLTAVRLQKHDATDCLTADSQNKQP